MLGKHSVTPIRGIPILGAVRHVGPSNWAPGYEPIVAPMSAEREAAPVNRNQHHFASAAFLLVMCASLQGCSSGPGGETTCSDYAALDSDSGLLSGPSDEQMKVLGNMLSDHDKMAGQESMAHLSVIEYCNIYGGAAGNHQDEPIENIPGME